MLFEFEIKRIYDSRPEAEWERLDRHRTEFAVTLRVLQEYLPPSPAKVLDCGGGPGRYAIELSHQGYEVTLLDLSEGNIALAKKKSSKANGILKGIHQGTATDLSRYASNSFDAMLMMGPLYHLVDRNDRIQALLEAHRVLKSNGLLFAAFITRYAPIRWSAANEPQWVLTHAKETQSILETGVLPPRGEKEGEFVAYFAQPEEVKPLIEEPGFAVLDIFGVEGLISEIEEKVNQLCGAAWETWVDLNYKLAKDPSLHGANEHLLAVAIKPE